MSSSYQEIDLNEMTKGITSDSLRATLVASTSEHRRMVLTRQLVGLLLLSLK